MPGSSNSWSTRTLQHTVSLMEVASLGNSCEERRFTCSMNRYNTNNFRYVLYVLYIGSRELLLRSKLYPLPRGNFVSERSFSTSREFPTIGHWCAVRHLLGVVCSRLDHWRVLGPVWRRWDVAECATKTRRRYDAPRMGS